MSGYLVSERGAVLPAATSVDVDPTALPGGLQFYAAAVGDDDRHLKLFFEVMPEDETDHGERLRVFVAEGPAAVSVVLVLEPNSAPAGMVVGRTLPGWQRAVRVGEAMLQGPLAGRAVIDGLRGEAVELVDSTPTFALLDTLDPRGPERQARFAESDEPRRRRLFGWRRGS